MNPGDKLENDFYEYLTSEIERGETLWGIFSAGSCNVFRHKRYFCKERNGFITFDVVIEVRRAKSANPLFTLFFECKDYASNVPESEVTTFSDQVERISKHNAKAFIVTTGDLQSGALNIVKSRGIGWIKFDKSGMEFVVERNVNLDHGYKTWEDFGNSNARHLKSAKFLSFDGHNFFSNPLALIQYSLEPNVVQNIPLHEKVRFVQEVELIYRADHILNEVGYKGGAVDLLKICNLMNIDLEILEEDEMSIESAGILGFADFGSRKIYVYKHKNLGRERFTVAHEIGHFALGHEDIVRKEITLKSDIKLFEESSSAIQRLEIQANLFASILLLPRIQFLDALGRLNEIYQFRDKGHGAIYVDQQPCNFTPYNFLIDDLASEFQVSKTVVENLLQKLRLVNDQREFH